MHFRSKQSGQAAVETAIVMPLNVFLILGIIQLGLISQARYMAKYAAYRAVRVGAMNHADKAKMVSAAEAALLPVVAFPRSGDKTGAALLTPTDSAGALATKILRLRVENSFILVPGVKMIDVVTCGPTRADVSSLTERNLTGVGSSKQVDFDDPRATMDLPNGWSPDSDLQKFLATKLRVQVQFYYVMAIPFANWIIAQSYMAMSVTNHLNLVSSSNVPRNMRANKVIIAYNAHVYVAPIFESYAMRMQSSIYTDKVPTSNNCVGWWK